MDYSCSLCGAGFYFARYLRAHEIRKHGTKKKNEKAKIFKCEFCEKHFSCKNSVYNHKKRIHPTKKRMTSRVNCQEENCDGNFRSIDDLRKHLHQSHQFEDFGKHQDFEFENTSDFLDWLDAEEEKTNSKFVITTNDTHKDYVYTLFSCNRSGMHTSKKEKCFRQHKARGSIKLGFHCTAGLTMKEFPTHVTVRYYKEHYGHIPVLKVRKEIMADTQGVEERSILNNLEESFETEEPPEKNNLVTNKDHQNIKNDFGSKGSAITADETSICSEVENMKGEKLNQNDFNIKSIKINKDQVSNKMDIDYQEQNKRDLEYLSAKLSTIKNMDKAVSLQIKWHTDAIKQLLKLDSK